MIFNYGRKYLAEIFSNRGPRQTATKFYENALIFTIDFLLQIEENGRTLYVGTIIFTTCTMYLNAVSNRDCKTNFHLLIETVHYFHMNVHIIILHKQ